MVRRRDPIHLDAIVSTSAEIVLQDAPGISLIQKIDDDVVEILGDAQKIGQMIRLLFQEVKSVVGEKGEIEVRLSTRENGDGVMLDILNDGSPMSEEELKNLFDPFFIRSDNPEELGTNLMACYLTVFHHGGSLRAYRAEDERNGIEVLLPLQPPSKGSRARNRGILDQQGAQMDCCKACDTVLPG